MAPSPPPRSWPRRGALLLLLAVLGAGGWLTAGQVRAWHHLNAGRAALERNDLPGARRHLQLCVEAWPSSAEANFLAARAARRSGEIQEASRRLDRASELRWVP